MGSIVVGGVGLVWAVGAVVLKLVRGVRPQTELGRGFLLVIVAFNTPRVMTSEYEEFNKFLTHRVKTTNYSCV